MVEKVRATTSDSYTKSLEVSMDSHFIFSLHLNKVVQVESCCVPHPPPFLDDILPRHMHFYSLVFSPGHELALFSVTDSSPAVKAVHFSVF